MKLAKDGTARTIRGVMKELAAKRHAATVKRTIHMHRMRMVDCTTRDGLIRAACDRRDSEMVRANAMYHTLAR